jgi:hypothetical protein
MIFTALYCTRISAQFQKDWHHDHIRAGKRYPRIILRVPVHSTAFRPVGDGALKRNAFRVFTSLFRLDSIADDNFAPKRRVLSERKVFTTGAVELTEKGERDGGLDKSDAQRLVTEVLETSVGTIGPMSTRTSTIAATTHIGWLLTLFLSRVLTSTTSHRARLTSTGSGTQAGNTRSTQRR